MNCFLEDSQGRLVGPYSLGELRLFLDRGLIDPGTPVRVEGSEVAWSAADVAAGNVPRLPASPPSAPAPPRTDGPGGGASGPSATRDFLRLAPHLMLPLEDLVRLRWLDNRRIVSLAVVGLLPLMLMLYLQGSQDIGGTIWGTALYSSLIWAVFFHAAFSQPDVRPFRCVLTFLGSALFSVGLVALARVLVPFDLVSESIASTSVIRRWAGNFFGVALIEETAKLFMLYFLWPQRLRPQVMMFYGLMAGLGFGIYEGVAYQSSHNLRVSFAEGRSPVESAALYYLLNILRLTSLPFLHALWTGIAGYFIGFATQFPERRGGLLLAACLVPSLLHATYNTFSAGALGFTVALVTVLALNLYLVKGRDFELLLTDPPRPGGADAADRTRTERRP